MCCSLHAVLDALTAWHVPEALLRARVYSAKAPANFRLGAGQSVVLLCASGQRVCDKWKLRRVLRLAELQGKPLLCVL